MQINCTQRNLHLLLPQPDRDLERRLDDMYPMWSMVQDMMGEQNLWDIQSAKNIIKSVETENYALELTKEFPISLHQRNTTTMTNPLSRQQIHHTPRTMQEPPAKKIYPNTPPQRFSKGNCFHTVLHINPSNKGHTNHNAWSTTAIHEISLCIHIHEPNLKHDIQRQLIWQDK